MANDFGVTVEELKKLNEKRGQEALDEISKNFGDVNELCRRLNTSPTDGMLWFGRVDGVGEVFIMRFFRDLGQSSGTPEAAAGVRR